LFYQGRWATYKEVEDLSNKVANYLRDIGVERHDRVTLIMENSLDYVVSFFAALKAGATVVPLQADITADQLAYVVENAESHIVIGSCAHISSISAALVNCPSVSHLLLDAKLDGLSGRLHRIELASLSEIDESGNRERPTTRTIDVDLAEIVYTSGSTGKPKGVMLTHLNLVSNSFSIVDYLKIDRRDRILAILPFSYIYGQSLLLTHILAAGSLVIHNGFLFPNAVLMLMIEQEATGFAGVPSTFSILLTRSAIRQMRFPSLRYVTQAGGSMAPELQAEVARIVAPAELVIMYGSTEASPRLSYLDPKDLAQKLGSIGKAVPNVDLFVADQNGRALPCGEEGEIVARGSNIMQGYWRDPEATRAVLRNGLYFTGDLGFMDNEGYLFVVGRTKEIIKVKGFRVSPKEIEDKLMEIPDISEAAVIGIKDHVLGEAIKAFVVLRTRDSISKKKILETFNSRMPVHKQIRDLSVVEALPKNSSGKVLKNVLKGSGA